MELYAAMVDLIDMNIGRVRTYLEETGELDNTFVGWEQLGIAAVRVGEWKALFLPPPKGPGKWELYDLSKDLDEVHDLAESHPEKLEEMLHHYETYFQETGMFDSYTMYQEALKQRKAEKMRVEVDTDHTPYVSTIRQSLAFIQEKFHSLLKGYWGKE